MAIQAIYDKLEDIEEKFRELYSERNNKFELTGITGIKTQADVDRALASANTYKEEHKQTKDRLRVVTFKGKSIVEMNNDQLKEAVVELDKYEELEAAAAGKIDDTKINQMVESRLRTKLAPVERERDQFKTQVEELDGKTKDYEQRERERKIDDAILAAKTKSKFADGALPDIQLNARLMLEVAEDGNVVTRDKVGVTPGVTPEIWLTEMQQKGRLWWPESVGNGAKGNKGNGNGNNPWSKAAWSMTEQSKAYRENPEKAKALAKAAGVEIGATKPKEA